MSKSAPQVVSISTPRYGEAVRTGDNRVIYTPTPGGWIPGDFVNEVITINMIVDSPPEAAVTDAAELRLQDAMNDRAERTTAFDVALQGLDDVRRRLTSYISGARMRELEAILAATEIAYCKAKAYRAEEGERLNEGFRERAKTAANRAIENVNFIAERDDAKNQADLFAIEIRCLQKELAKKQAEVAALQRQRDRYRGTLADIRYQINILFPRT